jgi:hypothetical protein
MKRPALRAALPTVLALIVVLGLPACDPLALCGSAPLTTVPAAASERATSCIEKVSFDGHDYTPWCAAVEPALIADSPRLGGDQSGNYYEGRFIQGVPPEQAIAVASIITDTSGSRRLERQCGGIWRIAFDTEVAETDANNIARQVVIPGSLRRT